MTVWTVRLALLCYLTTVAGDLLANKSEVWRRTSRWLWTAGCLLMGAHLAAAFHWRHGWSRAHAVAETARQTAEVLGWRWGGGVYFNYAFVAVWSGDVLWRWLGPQSYVRRSALLGAAIHAFLFFIAFNATVIFEDGAVRAAGIAGALALATLGLGSWRKRTNSFY